MYFSRLAATDTPCKKTLLGTEQEEDSFIFTVCALSLGRELASGALHFRLLDPWPFSFGTCWLRLVYVYDVCCYV